MIHHYYSISIFVFYDSDHLLNGEWMIYISITVIAGAPLTLSR